MIFFPPGSLGADGVAGRHRRSSSSGRDDAGLSRHRPSKWSSPSSSFSCWCACSQIQRALMVPASTAAASPAGKLER